MLCAMGLRAFLFGMIFLWPTLLWAEPPGKVCTSGEWSAVECIRRDHFAFDTCQMLESQARIHGPDPGFFARLIWQESRFDPNALSPANAMGIAQFIASTAALRGLSDPYNPAEALEHSAQYLGEMSRRYGNPGLAAVGYNGGERRAEGLIAKTGGLARETVNYVRIITGLPAETWRDAPPDAPDFRLSEEKPFLAACLDLAKGRRISAPRQPEPPAPAIPLWGVQIAFGADEAAAERAFTARARSCPGPLTGEKVFYISVKSRGQGRAGYIMARLGRNTRAAADDLCRAVSSAGCLCRVYRN
ncbi:MAG: lytic transglycosylase domain-containing protein [Pseudomonadota bacterium]